jgi:hypothetical protein
VATGLLLKPRRSEGGWRRGCCWIRGGADRVAGGLEVRGGEAGRGSGCEAAGPGAAGRGARCTGDAGQTPDLSCWMRDVSDLRASPKSMRVLSPKNSSLSMPAKPGFMLRFMTMTVLA